MSRRHGLLCDWESLGERLTGNSGLGLSRWTGFVLVMVGRHWV